MLQLSACGGAARSPVTSSVEQVPPARSADRGRLVTSADVAFISGMIAHHAQAVLIAGWAPANGASQSVRTLCERIVVSQRDEIALMQQWLRDQGEPVPAGDAAHDLHGMHDGALMPGMLTAEQLTQLGNATGAEFDRLFLTFMIQHHQGAITMVQQLIDSPGAAQDTRVFKLASDIHVDQATEIARMQGMLATLSLDSAGS
jgi:uncharacterized protein (DUF305 family)